MRTGILKGAYDGGGKACTDGAGFGKRPAVGQPGGDTGEESIAGPGGIGDGNPKGALQVRAQAMRPPRHPEYSLLNTTGPSHEPVFTVKVHVDGLGEAVAKARSHKEAEAKAAAALLESIS